MSFSGGRVGERAAGEISKLAPEGGPTLHPVVDRFMELRGRKYAQEIEKRETREKNRVTQRNPIDDEV